MGGHIVPFMLSVLFAKAIGDSLNEGIYDLQIVLKGYPFLHEKLDVTFTERCCDIMETRLTKLDVGVHPSLLHLTEMLQTTSYNGFPIVDGHHLIGYAGRQHLEDLVRCRTQQGLDGVITLQEVQECTDPTVMRMVPDAPLSQAHRVFQQLGCKYIFIVGTQSPEVQDALLGMISKKRFLSFLKNGNVGHRRDPTESSTKIFKDGPSSPSKLSVLDTAMAASMQDSCEESHAHDSGKGTP